MKAWSSVELHEAVLDVRHRGEGQWIVVRELRAGTGFTNGAAQQLDGWAMNCWPSKKWTRVCYEYKISRADYTRELKNPLKRRFGLLASNQFYFVAPVGVILAESIPVECGLLEVGRALIDKPPVGRITGFSQTAGKCWIRETVPAPWRDTGPPSWTFISSLARSLEARK